jgi:hypothetical protein
MRGFASTRALPFRLRGRHVIPRLERAIRMASGARVFAPCAECAKEQAEAPNHESPVARSRSVAACASA